jgi:hypothetical protein
MVQHVELLARFEAHSFAGSDADFGSGAGIAPDAGFARADIEDAKAPQFDALPLGKGPFECLENGVDSGLGFVALEAGALNHLVNDVLFYQGVPPSREESDVTLIVEIFDGIVNGQGCQSEQSCIRDRRPIRGGAIRERFRAGTIRGIFSDFP